MLVLLTFIYLLLNVNCQTDDMELVLVQAIWRHGDRSPTETYKNDKFTEDAWPFGGGGWGQLTPTGMLQHMRLGQKIRERYINSNYQFLSPRYKQGELYVRSTDKNRTLISAMSNLLGMYGMQNDSGIPGIDYPSEPGWPTGYVPIPIHTIEDSVDHLLDVDNFCPLQDTVWKLANETKELQSLYNNKSIQNLMANLTINCGEPINLENLWILYNALKIEKLYYPQNFTVNTPWYTDDIFNEIDELNAQVQDYQNGLGLEGTMVKGIDVGLMLKQIRGGTLINDMNNRMHRKINCRNDKSELCRWTNNLKYFAYSAHDTTLYALLSVLGIANDAVQPRGYPDYSACILIEMWRNKNDESAKFKLIYYRNENDTLENVLTKKITGCKDDFCDLEIFEKFAKKYTPKMEMNKWCDYDIFNHSSSANVILLIFSYLFYRLL